MSFNKNILKGSLLKYWNFNNNRLDIKANEQCIVNKRNKQKQNMHNLQEAR